MATVFFSKANMAAAVGGIAFFITYIPYSFIQKDYEISAYSTKVLISLAQNSAMALGFNLIVKYEGTGAGVQWSNLFTPVTPDDDMTFGLVLIMLLFDSILYTLIALYVEAVFPGEFGVPMPWYFPFTASFWCGHRYTGRCPPK